MSDFCLSAFADEAAESLEGQIEALKRNNIQQIEIRNIDGKCVIDFSEDELKEIKNILNKNNIKVSAIASPIGKSNIDAPFEDEIERYRKTLNSAKILNTKRIRMFSFFIPKEKNPESYRDEVLKRIKVFTDMAKENEVFCYHENEKEIYGDIKDRVLDLHKNNSDLKGIFDPANYIQCKQNPIKIVEEIKPYIDYIHIKDAVMEDGSVVPSGYGDGNIDKLLEIFYKKDGNMLLTVEPHLTVFKGLNNLQDEEIKHKFTFNSQEEAFDTAVNALKNILNRKGYSYE